MQCFSIVRRLLLPLIVVGVALAVGGRASAAGNVACPTADVDSLVAVECAHLPAVESLDPEFSENFEPPPSVSAFRSMRSALQSVACRPADAVFYAATDWIRLAQKLRADASPCADYYISVPPLAADTTQPRAGQASQIRALGPRFHAMAEIHWTGWSTWVRDNRQTWFNAGVEARRRMKAAGYDVALGDTWAVNELPSSVRRNDGTARADAQEFARGLFLGDGTAPSSKGLFFVVGLGQPTSDTSVYKGVVKTWLEDSAFWNDMALYVRFWAQEAYPDALNWGVAGTAAAERRDYLNDFVQHKLVLAEAGPDSAAAARSFLESAYLPLANAAWQWDTGFGTTMISSAQMKHFVSTQTYAMRYFSGANSASAQSRLGFAWAPKNGSVIPAGDFTKQTAEILDRLANALHLSDQEEGEPGIGACGAALEWCGGEVEGASFNNAWKLFGSWTAPVAQSRAIATDDNTPVDFELRASDADGDELTYVVVEVPAHGTLDALGGNRYRYTPTEGYSGADRIRFRVSDGHINSNVATVSITVNHVNRAPVAVDDAGLATDEDTAATLTPGSLLANDTDADGDPLVISNVAGTATTHGEVSLSGTDVVYRPEADYNGPASFGYSISDGHGGSASATASLVVNAVNDAPVVELAEAGPIDEGAAPIGLAARASDVDRDELSYAWATDAGTLAPAGPTAAFSAHDGPGSARVTVTVSDGRGATASASRTIDVRNVPPTVDAGPARSGPWGLALDLQGTIGDPSSADVSAGLAPTWTLGDGSAASTGTTLRHAYGVPGSYEATLTATDKDGAAAHDSTTVTIEARPTTLLLSDQAVLPVGQTTLTARLVDRVDAASARLAGHDVTLTLGTQSCGGVTDGSGFASCTIDAGSQPLGPAAVTAAFAGDQLYGSSTATASVLVYAFAAGGSFVVGDRSGSAVTFWSPEWSKDNPVSTGGAPASFKGFTGLAQPACGARWTARPGHSGGAPSAVPAYMAVIVASSVTKSGPEIAGDVLHVVIVRTEPGYSPDGSGRGTVVATVC